MSQILIPQPKVIEGKEEEYNNIPDNIRNKKQLKSFPMKKISLGAFLTLCLILSVKAQEFFEFTAPKYVSTFSPLNLNLIQRSLENRQRQYDNNLAYLRSLLNWAQDLRGKETDAQFTAAMDHYIKVLNNMYGQDLSAEGTTLSRIENYINSEINDYNKRAEELKNPDQYWQKGIEYYNNGYYDSAIVEFKKVKSLAPDFTEVYSALGTSYYAIGDLNSSLINYNISIEMNPTKELYERRGWVKYYQGDYYEALSDFTKQISIDPSSAVAYYNRGTAKSELQDYYGAINDFKKAIELNPSISMIYNNLGWVKFLQKDYQSALKYLNKAIDKDSSNSIAWDSRGEIKFHLKDYKGCIYDCTKALELNRELANSYFIRGRAKYRLGLNKEACIEWSEAGQFGEKEAYEYIQKYCNK